MKSDSFNKTEPFWRQFERLAVQMVSEAFNVTPGVVYVTHPSKDGGYDGVISHSLAEDIFDVEDLTYVEAKLRSAERGIGLRDFAATVIIALNDAAQTLVVVANRPFTEQAFEQACRFFMRTNLRVKLVDGATVSGWVRRNHSVLEGQFSPELLNDLTLKQQTREQVKEYRFDCHKQSYLARPWILENEQVTLRTGWQKDGTPADCELKSHLTNQVQSGNLPALIGKKRALLVKDLSKALSANSGIGNIVGLTGTGGVGKSVIVGHVLQRLTRPRDGDSRSWTGMVDVGKASSSRLLFIAILTAIFGIDPRDLTEGETDYWEADVLISRLGGDQATPSMLKAVRRSLQRGLQEYESSWDLNTGPLLDFLQQVVRNRCRSQAMTLVFHELNKSTSETLDFLYQVARILAEAGASVLLEIRDQGYERTASKRSQDGHLAVLPMHEWKAFVDLFRTISAGGVFHVDTLSEGESVAYLEDLIPGLGNDRAKVIIRYVGTIPLHLNLTAEWHKAEKIFHRPDGGIYLLQDIERFFIEQEITPASVDAIFDRVIEAWWNHPESIYRSSIAAAALLDGRLPFSAIECLIKNGDSSTTIENLIESGLFILSMDTKSEIEVAHDLIRERMATFKSGRSPVHAQIAQRLLQQLSLLYSDELTQKMRRVDLLEALGSENAYETCCLSHAVANSLAQTRDWSQASRYYEKACRAIGGCIGSVENSAQQTDELRILIDWLEVEVLRYRIGLKKNMNRLSAMLNLLRFPGDIDRKSTEYQTIEIQAANIEWRYYYVHEDFEKALEVAERGRRKALQCNPDVDVEVRGKALSNYAVTLKVLDRRKESFDVFDEAFRILPGSYTIEAERLSNIAAFALRDDPAKALSCYQELLERTHNTVYSFSEIIHAHVDVSMADFLKNDLKAAEHDAQHAILLAQNNGVPAEEARGRNILGCVLWATDRIKEAHREFEKAVFASERSISHRFLWRMRTNAAGAAVELGEISRAYSFAIAAEQAILTPREKNFADIAEDVTYMTSRWYAALIAIGSYFDSMAKHRDLDRLFKRVTLPFFRKHVEQFINGTPPAKVFDQTTHLKAGRIMITG